MRGLCNALAERRNEDNSTEGRQGKAVGRSVKQAKLHHISSGNPTDSQAKKENRQETKEEASVEEERRGPGRRRDRPCVCNEMKNKS